MQLLSKVQKFKDLETVLSLFLLDEAFVVCDGLAEETKMNYVKLIPALEH